MNIKSQSFSNTKIGKNEVKILCSYTSTLSTYHLSVKNIEEDYATSNVQISHRSMYYLMYSYCLLFTLMANRNKPIIRVYINRCNIFLADYSLTCNLNSSEAPKVWLYTQAGHLDLLIKILQYIILFYTIKYSRCPALYTIIKNENQCRFVPMFYQLNP